MVADEYGQTIPTPESTLPLHFHREHGRQTEALRTLLFL